VKGKFLRGTVLDPFGHTRMRRLERRLAAHYESTILELLSALTAENYGRAVAIARAPELIRGYEEVKVHNLERYFTRLGELGIDTATLLL
jgi:indolepyruvate ferredoxin oxidoreductase